MEIYGLRHYHFQASECERGVANIISSDLTMYVLGFDTLLFKLYH